jgi:predicted helicase
MGTKDGKRQKSKSHGVLFSLYSLGIATNRDELGIWISREAVNEQMSKHVRHFNNELERYRRDYSSDESL